MTDVLVRLREQAGTQQAATSATQTWTPTAPVAVAAGLLLPAPKAIAIPAAGTVTITGVEPCNGLTGWCWTVTTTEDGAIRDQRNVIVPDSMTALNFEDLATIQLADFRSLTPEGVWVGLEDNPPPAWFRGWWLVSAPGNPAGGFETGSGDLRSVL